MIFHLVDDILSTGSTGVKRTGDEHVNEGGQGGDIVFHLEIFLNGAGVWVAELFVMSEFLVGTGQAWDRFFHLLQVNPQAAVNVSSTSPTVWKPVV